MTVKMAIVCFCGNRDIRVPAPEGEPEQFTRLECPKCGASGGIENFDLETIEQREQGK